MSTIKSVPKSNSSTSSNSTICYTYYGEKQVSVSKFIKNRKEYKIKPMNHIELAQFKKTFLMENKTINCPSIINYSNGNVYKGEINQNGRRNGLGELFYENGDVFAVKWENDIANGCGVMYTLSGIEYRGRWLNNLIHGKQIIIKYPNGDVYKGNMINDEMSGQGIYNWSNGDSYVGEWKNDKMNGYGILDSSCTLGKIIKGEWIDGISLLSYQQKDNNKIICVE